MSGRGGSRFNRRRGPRRAGPRVGITDNPVFRKRQTFVKSGQVNGLNLHPREDPNRIVQNPWNTVTLEFEGVFTPTTDAPYLVITVDSVVNRFQTQVGIVPSQVVSGAVEFRVNSIRAWNQSGTRIQMDCADFLYGLYPDATETHRKCLTTVGDNPGKSGNARVGYLWPQAMRKQTFFAPTSTNNILAQLYDFPGQASYLVQLDINWRTSGYVQVDGKGLDITSAVENLSI